MPIRVWACQQTGSPVQIHWAGMAPWSRTAGLTQAPRVAP